MRTIVFNYKKGEIKAIRRLLFSLFIYFSFVINNVVAQDLSIASPQNPRLVVAIVIEQMRSDYISRFWDKFSEGGFKRLINEGTYCRNASYSHFFTQTAPGYASLYTGSFPSLHGIVANEWYDRVSNKWIKAVVDESVRTVGGPYDAGRFSPRNLLATTISDEIKVSNFRQSKVYSVSLEPVSAVLSGGHTADGAFWYDDENGNWITSSYYMRNLPEWLDELNKKKFTDMYLEKTWNTSFPVTEYIHSLTDANSYEVGIAGRSVFPYSLPDIGKGLSISARYRLLKQTPFGNTFTKDLAIATIVNENLGKGRFTDMITISLTATENIGNAFGPLSIEVEDAFIKLDKDLEHFLQFIDYFVGKQNALIIVTSNHGAAQMPGYLTDIKIPVGSFNANNAVSLLRSYLNAIYGSGDWITGHFGGQIYLNADLIENSKLNIEDMRNKIAQFIVQFTGVSHSITATELQKFPYTDGFQKKMQNNYYPRRSGDVFINLYPGWVERSTWTTAHNSAYLYDAQVPLIWYGWKIKRETIFRPIDMTDVAPTITTILNIMAPNATTGKIIEEIVK